MSAAAGALMLAAPGAALAGPDACTIDGPALNQTATCKDNQSAGIKSGAGGDFSAANVTVLEVKNLSGDITPTPGDNADGIRFTSTRDVTVKSTANITVSGQDADGIEARSNFGGLGSPGGNVVVESTGTITSGDARGIYASAGNVPTPSLNVSVKNNGAITAREEGIYARSFAGTVTVDSTGRIISSADPATEPLSARYSVGIKAFTGNTGASAIDIINTGDIDATSYGINAVAGGGSITIDSTGNIKSGIGQTQSTNYGDGIRAASFEYSNPAASVGNITIKNTGDIQAKGRGSGILAYSVFSDSAIISVEHVSGTITGGDGDNDGDAIKVLASEIAENGTITATVTTSGKLKGGGTTGAGINLVAYTYVAGAKMNGTVVIMATGEVEGGGGIDGTAIRSYASGLSDTTGSVTVENYGTVTGSVSLRDQFDTGTNAFKNMLGGVFNMGSFVYLGDGNDLTNAGTLSPGGDGAVSTTMVTGNLVLAGTSQINFDLGQANFPGGTKNDLLDVSGDLTLDGNIMVTESAGGSFTGGVYRLINYGGTLTDNGLGIAGTLPNGLTGTIQTGFANQVNLVVSAGDIGYWDGPNVTPGLVANGRGGTGTWDASLTNWTNANGYANGPWDSGVAVFAGTAGTVTVEGTQAFSGMQFMTGGYQVVAGTGGALNLGTGAFIYTDIGKDATIGVSVGGTGALDKQGDGRLILTGTNTFSGGTKITAGTLAAGANGALGSGSVSISNGAALQANAAGLTLANGIVIGSLASDVATIDTQGNTLALSGNVTGPGTMKKKGSGTLELSGAASAVGGVDIAEGGLTNKGTLSVSGTAAMGSGTALTNAAGAVLTVSGGVTGDAGAQSVTNAGTMTASINLGGGANSFDNQSGGVFNMGSFVYLGDGNNLTNAGTLSPGGDSTVSTTKVTGNLIQTSSGKMRIDVDGIGTDSSDRIEVTGTADLAGQVDVTVLNPVSTSQKFTILSAALGVTSSSLTLTGGLPVEFSLLYPNANDVVLGVTVDFTLDENDLNRNQTALAENLNGIINLGGGGVSPVTNALLGITDLDQYRSALNQLLPEHYLNLQAATLFAAEDFAQALMSCRERDGAYAVIAEGQCIWAEADVNRFDQDGTSEQMQTEEDSYRFSAGGQFGLSEQWHMGFAFRYETLEQDTGDSASSDGQRFHAGAALKYNQGPLLLAGAVSAGRTWYDTERDFGFDGFSDSASSSHEVDYLNGLLRGALLVPLGDYYLKPIADLNVAHVSSDGFKEDDGGGAALEFEDADGTYLSLSPALEAGAEWRLSSGTLVRPFVGGGVTWYSETGFTGTSSFVDAPEGAGSFVTRTEIDEVMGEVAAGIDIIGAGNFDLRLRYEGAFGETVTNQSLGLRAAWRL